MLFRPKKHRAIGASLYVGLGGAEHHSTQRAYFLIRITSVSVVLGLVIALRAGTNCPEIELRTRVIVFAMKAPVYLMVRLIMTIGPRTWLVACLAEGARFELARACAMLFRLFHFAPTRALAWPLEPLEYPSGFGTFISVSFPTVV
jgi:hypothetical protein